MSKFNIIIPYIWLIILILIKTHIHNHTCIHDHLENIQPNYLLSKEEILINPDTTTPRSIQIRNLNTVAPIIHQNIRIHLDFSGVNQALNNTIQNTIVNLANSSIQYFQSILLVHPITYLINFTSDICYQAQVPPLFMTTGVNQTDLLIFVTTSFSNTNFLVWGVTCLLDSKTNRPIAAQLNFNEKYINTTIYAWDQQISSTLHELIHILGFSQSLFPYFVSSITGNLLTQVTTKAYRNGIPNQQIILPDIITLASNYFGCTTLSGLDLEQQGNLSNSGSHWERRIMGNEIMTANYIDDFRISIFTLSVLNNTGWYYINSTMADTFSWGVNKGCSFLEGPCMNNASVGYGSAYEEFCSPYNTYGCSRDASAIGYCSYSLGEPQYSQWDYYNNGSISVDPFSDNCPYYYPMKNCEKAWNNDNNIFIDAYYGTGSKCFSGTFIKSQFSSNYTGNQVAGCFYYHCYPITNTTDWELHIYFGTNTAICTKYQGTEPISNYIGVVNCPNANTFCAVETAIYCKRGCMGRGTCLNKSCVCSDGWGGSDCSQMITYAGCKGCSQNLTTPNPDCIGDTCACDPSVHLYCRNSLNLNPSFGGSVLWGDKKNIGVASIISILLVAIWTEFLM